MPELSRRELNLLLLASLAAPNVLANSMPTSGNIPMVANNLKIAFTTWSLHMPLWKGELSSMQVPALATELGAQAIEWVSKTFRDLRGGRGLMFEAPPASFFHNLRDAVADAGNNSKVLNAGGPFYLADVDNSGRQKAVDFFLQYVEPAQILGCDILRAELYCNAPHREGRQLEAKKLAMEGLNLLLEKTSGSGLIINIENHHGISAQPEWLADLICSMNHPRLGLTADTNNFRIDQDMPYNADAAVFPINVDRYHGLDMLLPLANWVSAKTYAFDNTGYELSMNYSRIFEIINKSGYSGYLSVEYEGDGNPVEGIRNSIAMLKKFIAKSR